MNVRLLMGLTVPMLKQITRQQIAIEAYMVTARALGIGAITAKTILDDEVAITKTSTEARFEDALRAASAKLVQRAWHRP